MSGDFPVLRQPNAYELHDSNMARYLRWLRERGYGDFQSYQELHRWSVTELERFWESIWQFTGVIASQPYTRVLGRRDMPGAEWFVGARLNFAENLLRHALHGDPARPAVCAISRMRSP